MKLKFWEKKPEVTREEPILLTAFKETVASWSIPEPKPEERSGFIREVSHKHLTTRGRR